MFTGGVWPVIIVTMAKNTSSSAFRKIDVDQYCEDNYKEDEVDQVGPQGPDENEVNNLLQKYPFLFECILQT